MKATLSVNSVEHITFCGKSLSWHASPWMYLQLFAFKPLKVFGALFLPTVQPPQEKNALIKQPHFPFGSHTSLFSKWAVFIPGTLCMTYVKPYGYRMNFRKRLRRVWILASRRCDQCIWNLERCSSGIRWSHWTPNLMWIRSTHLRI